MTDAMVGKIAMLGVALAGGLLAGAAWAQDMASVISSRKDVMKAIFAATSDVKKAVVAGEGLVAAAARAREIADYTKKLPVLFPARSGPASGLKTRSLASIWEYRADFNAIAGRLAQDAERLAAALRKDDKAAVAAAFAATTEQCGACHRRYRARR